MSPRIDYDKAIRDAIPKRLEAHGVPHKVTRVPDVEFARYLEQKLLEEVEEFREAKTPEELADILEVVFALASRLGVDEQELLRIRAAKRDERGAFEQNLVLEWTE